MVYEEQQIDGNIEDSYIGFKSFIEVIKKISRIHFPKTDPKTAYINFSRQFFTIKDLSQKQTATTAHIGDKLMQKV